MCGLRRVKLVLATEGARILATKSFIHIVGNHHNLIAYSVSLSFFLSLSKLEVYKLANVIHERVLTKDESLADQKMW